MKRIFTIIVAAVALSACSLLPTASGGSPNVAVANVFMGVASQINAVAAGNCLTLPTLPVDPATICQQLPATATAADVQAAVQACLAGQDVLAATQQLSKAQKIICAATTPTPAVKP